MSGEVPAREGVKLSRFLTGVFDPRTHIKLVAFVLVAFIWLMVGTGIYSIWSKFKPKEKVVSVSPSRVSGDSTINSGGDVKTLEIQSTQSDTRSTNTTVTNMPFANGILGQFGSWFKTQGNEEVKEKR